MIRFTTGLACAAMLALAGAAQASSQDRVDRLLTPSAPQTAAANAINDGEAYHRADDVEQDPAELRMTRALNDEITSRNALAESQERADQAAYDAERARYEQSVSQSMQAQLAYEEDLRQSAAARQQYEAARDRWQADVRACQAGDRARCAAPSY